MKTHQLHALIRILKYTKNYRIEILFATLFSVANALFSILPEVLIGLAVDVVVYRHHSLLARLGIENMHHQLITLGVLTFCIWVIEAITEYFYLIKWRNLAQAVQHQLRIDTYKHIQKADMSYFENTSSGNLVSILNDDINQLERFFDNGMNMIIHIIASTLFVGLFFIFLSPTIALLAFMPVPFVLLGAYYFQRFIGPKYDTVRAKAGELNSRFTANMLGIATIKSYATEEHELSSLNKQSMEYKNANALAIRLSSIITPLIRFAILIGFLSTLIYGGFLTLNNQLAVSAYSILVFLSQRLLWPLTYLAEVTDHFYRAMASINRVLNLLALPINITSGAHIPKHIHIKGDIQFQHLSFTYRHGGKKPIIHNLNLSIPAGHMVGFVGGTGAGKSTIVKMLLRFYDPSNGSIKLDGKDLKEYDLKSLRRLIGYVSQDVFLFNGTIADNIKYGTFTATFTEIEQAAKLAQAHEFITSLPAGYQTNVGERGARLSGGQKQRLSIARAILKNPPILILDEATSAVDNETEAAIQQSLNEISVGRTTIIIAHRLNAVRNADTIYVLEQGEIIEQGDHDTLIASDTLYAWLWQLQTGAIY